MDNVSRVDKLLIANRGEIAVRIIHAARVLGISPVTIHSHIDNDALHKRLSDQSYNLGKGPSNDTYLNINKIIEAAYWLDVDAIHPGYGFLSENPEFAQRVIDEGFTWVGPSPHVIKKLGNKTEARKAAAKVGLSIVQGSDNHLESLNEAKTLAREIGYPIILKASYGGGGMGMAVIKNETELEKKYEQTKKQVEAAFGKSEIFMEKYLEKPKHIEFQFLADSHGHAVHLYERECSLQRRHQKIIEEAPSTVLTQRERMLIGRKVVKLVKSLHYENAGTAEFLYKDGELYFNEVNTRIQVEHPITEMITGMDLIIEQLRIAQKEPLRYSQKDIPLRGHAIEMRVNAENPYEGFTPSPGTVKELEVPSGPWVRFDTALYRGYTIPAEYDPMIGKLIVWGDNRLIAIERAKYSLQQLNIMGFQTNIPFHEVILHHPDFLEGNVHTQFIEASDINERLHHELRKKIVALFSVKQASKKILVPTIKESRWRDQSRKESAGWM